MKNAILLSTALLLMAACSAPEQEACFCPPSTEAVAAQQDCFGCPPSTTLVLANHRADLDQVVCEDCPPVVAMGVENVITVNGVHACGANCGCLRHDALMPTAMTPGGQPSSGPCPPEVQRG